MNDHETAPVDLSGLSDIRDRDKGLFREVIDQYLKDASCHLAILQEATGKGDAETVRQEAHALKGSSGFFNAKGMHEFCQRLETLGKSGTLTGATEHLSALQEEFIRVRTALEVERQKAA